ISRFNVTSTDETPGRRSSAVIRSLISPRLFARQKRYFLGGSAVSWTRTASPIARITSGRPPVPETRRLYTRSPASPRKPSGGPRGVERLRGAGASPRPARVGGEVRRAEDRGVEGDPVPLEDAALLEAMEPLADRGRGQADPPSERLQALPRVLVERDEQAKVLRIHGAPKARRP